MTTIDWKALKPHVPVGLGDAQYVERSGSAGNEIAQWILADRSPLLVGGPTGVGKSTELARAAELLQPDRVACLVQLDRFENMRRLTPDRMMLRVVSRLGGIASDILHLPLSNGLRQKLGEVQAHLQGDWELDFAPASLLDAAAAEIARVARQGRVTLLIDGLEKVPPGPDSLDLFDALGALRDQIELVVVIPWHAAFGPHSETVIRAGEHFVPVRSLDVDGPTDRTARSFLRELLARRLELDRGLDEAAALVMEDAIYWSGGVPRTFLQLMAGAGLYAARRRDEPWPRQEDMVDALADHIESVGRLFMPGDEAAIRSVVGTTGRELALERKVRLMAHGILLERMRNGAATLQLHPIAEAALAQGRPHA